MFWGLVLSALGLALFLVVLYLAFGVAMVALGVFDDE